MKSVLLIAIHVLLANAVFANNSEFLQNNKLKKGDHFQYYYTELIEKRQEPVKEEILLSGSDKLYRILFDFKVVSRKKDEMILEVSFKKYYEYNRFKTIGERWKSGALYDTEIEPEESMKTEDYEKLKNFNNHIGGSYYTVKYITGRITINKAAYNIEYIDKNTKEYGKAYNYIEKVLVMLMDTVLMRSRENSSIGLQHVPNWNINKQLQIPSYVSIKESSNKIKKRSFTTIEQFKTEEEVIVSDVSYKNFKLIVINEKPYETFITKGKYLNEKEVQKSTNTTLVVYTSGTDTNCIPQLKYHDKYITTGFFNNIFNKTYNFNKENDSTYILRLDLKELNQNELHYAGHSQIILLEPGDIISIMISKENSMVFEINETGDAKNQLLSEIQSFEKDNLHKLGPQEIKHEVDEIIKNHRSSISNEAYLEAYYSNLIRWAIPGVKVSRKMEDGLQVLVGAPNIKNQYFNEEFHFHNELLSSFSEIRSLMSSW
ncbi:MAG: hypothetical protein MI922_28870 [Bacteroidales bacterium]|nr:hypothetical protein [Bacteroidales bacterium]